LNHLRKTAHPGAARAAPVLLAFSPHQCGFAFLDMSPGLSRQEMERFSTRNEVFPTGNETFRTGNEGVSPSREGFRTGNEAFPDMSRRVITSREVFPTCREAFHFLS
jgi:hypothetical protein